MIIEVDALRRQLDDYTTPPEEFRHVALREWARAARGFSRAVIMVGPPGSGKSTWLRSNAQDDVLYFDATMTHRGARKQAQRVAEEAGARVEFVVMMTPLAECLRRNATRKGFFRVPDEQIARQWHDLHTSLPKTNATFV